MKRGFFNFMRLNQHKRKTFIFDLDRTLWDFTVEYCPSIGVKDIHNYIHSSRQPILQTIQGDGHSLNIASRSKEPAICQRLLREAYPSIHFSSNQIFYTPFEHKRLHINNILRETGEYDEHSYRPEDFFYFFDDEKKIIDDTTRAYKSKFCFHTPLGLHYGTFDFLK